jgi:hypothetical protein
MKLSDAQRAVLRDGSFGNVEPFGENTHTRTPTVKSLEKKGLVVIGFGLRGPWDKRWGYQITPDGMCWLDADDIERGYKDRYLGQRWVNSTAYKTVDRVKELRAKGIGVERMRALAKDHLDVLAEAIEEADADDEQILEAARNPTERAVIKRVMDIRDGIA